MALVVDFRDSEGLTQARVLEAAVFDRDGTCVETVDQ
jgi:hypothetical protein